MDDFEPLTDEELNAVVFTEADERRMSFTVLRVMVRFHDQLARRCLLDGEAPAKVAADYLRGVRKTLNDYEASSKYSEPSPEDLTDGAQLPRACFPP